MGLTGDQNTIGAHFKNLWDNYFVCFQNELSIFYYITIIPQILSSNISTHENLKKGKQHELVS